VLRRPGSIPEEIFEVLDVENALFSYYKLPKNGDHKGTFDRMLILDDQKISDVTLIAYRAALQAGEKILEVYESDDFNVEQKDDKSPLTSADRRSHELIEAALALTGIPLLSEEGADIPAAERQKWDVYWLIDPLDGTKEFIKRNGEFTVNIALMAPTDDAADGHAPVAGVVYVPVKDVAYVGIKGEGAWKIEGAAGVSSTAAFTASGTASAAVSKSAASAASAGDSTKISSLDDLKSVGKVLPLQDPLARPFSAVMSRSHNSPETEEYVAQLERQFGPAERVSSGSSIKLCLVAEGVADVYPRFAPTMEWDTAAGDAVCRAAGCRVSQKDGVSPLQYNKDDLLNPWFVVQGPRLL